jgi:E3 ubiquitin-protein ligase MYCBP2
VAAEKAQQPPADEPQLEQAELCEEPLDDENLAWDSLSQLRVVEPPGRLGQDREELCGICGAEELGAAPAHLLSGCGHVFHWQCLRDRVARRWPGRRMHFGYLECPLCGQDVDSPALREQLEVHLRARERVRRLALERLEHEGLLREPQLVDPSSEWFGRPAAWAEQLYQFFECDRCGVAYFGGAANCAQQAAAAAAAAADDDDEDAAAADGPAGDEAGLVEGGQQAPPAANPAGEVLCPGCAVGPDGGNLVECRKHGTDWISWKCRFCCTQSIWFCFGGFPAAGLYVAMLR